MGADSALAAQGEDEIVDTELAPSDGSRDAIGESFDSQLGKALLEGLGVPDDFGSEVEAAEQPEALPSDEDEAETPHGEATTPATDAPPSIEEQMPRWVEQVSGNPKSINQIPAKHHPAIMEALVARNAVSRDQLAREQREAGREEARQEVAAEQRRQATAAAVDEINQLKATDAEGYVAWRDQYPDRARNYDAFLDEQRNPRPVQADPTAPYMTLGERLSKKLAAEFPAAYEKARVESQQNPALYSASDDGVAYLTELLATARAEAIVASRTAKEAPARAALEQRQANTAERRTAPRPDVSAGQRGGEPLTNDVGSLLEMAFRGQSVAAR